MSLGLCGRDRYRQLKDYPDQGELQYLAIWHYQSGAYFRRRIMPWEVTMGPDHCTAAWPRRGADVPRLSTFRVLQRHTVALGAGHRLVIRALRMTKDSVSDSGCFLVRRYFLVPQRNSRSDLMQMLHK